MDRLTRLRHAMTALKAFQNQWYVLECLDFGNDNETNSRLLDICDMASEIKYRIRMMIIDEERKLNDKIEN